MYPIPERSVYSTCALILDNAHWSLLNGQHSEVKLFLVCGLLSSSTTESNRQLLSRFDRLFFPPPVSLSVCLSVCMYVVTNSCVIIRNAGQCKFGTAPTPAPGNYSGSGSGYDFGSGTNVLTPAPYIRNITISLKKKHGSPLCTQ